VKVESKYGSWMSSLFFAMLLFNAFGAGIPWWVVWFPVASPLVSAVVASSLYVTKSFWQRDSLVELKAELLVAKSQLDALTCGKPQFSKAEIAQLIKLCHPDKHGGSEAAGEITKKLLLMRK